MGSIGFPELLIILFLVLLLFGAKRLPQVARSIGKSVREFKRGMKTEYDEANQDSDSKSSQS
ncbi:MAG: twin-arginine translocase TatA/TatE family subunit [Spirochaetales bacterium]|nr:twin-arginine translocase TatA/TatE family subunit [Spirochaetales bacterium]MCF7938893.1 twin-arginine translocase TatA/TatE family subunit [Spirochaetales bacterium]